MLEGLRRRLGEWGARERLDRDAGEELSLHVELALAERVRAGMDEAEARRRVRLELGGLDPVRERLREGRSGFLVDSLVKDAAYALRMLRKRPGFATVCVLSIGLGVGASTALFALVDAVVLRPLPFPRPESLVRVFETNPGRGVERTGAASANVADWRRRARLFEGIAGYYSMGRTLSAEGASEVVLTCQASEDFFPLLGVAAAIGRTFTPEEAARARFDSAAAPAGPDPVVVLGDGLWRRWFGGDPGIVGRTVLLERRPFRVVGVMPPGFAMPEPEVQLWIPWDLHGDELRDQRYVRVVARLRPGVALPRAEGDLDAVARSLAGEHPAANEGWGVTLVPLHDEVVGDAGRPLWILMGAVGLVLLVACANVALLSLARGLERGHEASIRLALGATRGRLVRQHLVESALLAGAGGVLGALLAVAGIELARRVQAPLPRLPEAAIDARALLFALAATAAAALVAGLLPAWRRAQGQPARALAGECARLTVGRGGHAIRDGLVVAEVAMAVALLAGASLLVRSYLHLRGVDPGFDPRGVLVAPVFLDTQQYGSGEKTRAYYARLFERLLSLPGVVSVGGATALPASPLGPDFERPVWPEESPDPRGRRPAWVRMVTPRYFETLGMRLVEGRGFDGRDGPDGARAVVLAEGLARRLWPGGSAVGRRLVVDYSRSGTYPYHVVGVVNDVRFGGPRREPRPEIYLSHAQRPYLVMNVAVRASTEPWRLAPAVREVFREIDAQKPAHGVHSLEELLGATYARDRQAMLVLSAFALVSVLLSLLGLHGILLHRVRERTREIGIRIAVGAGRGRVLAWVAGQGLRLTLAGVALGLALAAASWRALSALLVGVSPADPAPALVVGAFPLVALLVALHPAWGATRIDAAEVLRRG